MAGGSHTTQWTFTAYRTVKEVEFSDFMTLEGPQWKGKIVKNTLCARETAHTGAEEGIAFTSEECCTEKAGPQLVKPCGGKFDECDDAIHARVLDQWENAK